MKSLAERLGCQAKSSSFVPGEVSVLCDEWSDIERAVVLHGTASLPVD